MAIPDAVPRSRTIGPSRRALLSRTRGASRLRSMACRRSCASAIAWKVPAVIRPSTPRRPMRDTSSPAARRVNVTASTWRDSSRPSRAPYAMRRVSTRVLPEPAGAMMASGAALEVTASYCAGSRSSSSASRTLGPYTSGATRARFGDTCRRLALAARTGPDAARPRVVFAACAVPISSGPCLRRLVARLPSQAPDTGSPVHAPARKPTHARLARTSVPFPQAGSESDASANQECAHYDRAPRASSRNADKFSASARRVRVARISSRSIHTARA